MQGLEDQLLALVVNKERPDLEETKTQLIIQNTEFTIKLKQLEDELLYKLSTAEGDITGAACHTDPRLCGCSGVLHNCSFS
jgi:dynein heavy chain